MGKNYDYYISRQIHIPPAFEEVFTHFYVAENHGTDPVNKTLVPSFQTILVFSFGTPLLFIASPYRTLSIDECSILGPVKRPFDYTLPPGAEMLVANFRKDGFFRTFGRVIQAIQPVHPDELLHDNCFSHLWKVLKALGTMEERVSRILDFTRPYLRPGDTVIAQIEQARNEGAAGSTKKEATGSPVKIVAGHTGLTRRSIQLKHKQRLGYSEKEFTRYERFLKALELVNQSIAGGHKVDWFDIVDDCGYYDQSQLIHDFKRYLGLSPTRYLKVQQDICRTAPS